MSIFEEIFSHETLNKNEFIRLDTILNKITELCEEYDNPRILDVGCGDGRMSIALYKLGYSVMAVDSSDEMLQKVDELCHINGEIFMCCKYQDARDMDFEDNSFDIVICSEVLEHIEEEYDVDRVISEIKRVCKDNSDILITVPYMNAVKGTKAFPHYREFKPKNFLKYFKYLTFFDMPAETEHEMKWIGFTTINEG